MFDPQYLLQTIPVLAQGVRYSLSIMAVGFGVGAVLGLLLALVRIYKTPVLTPFAALYVSFFRGTPLLVQIMLCYYGVPLLLRALSAPTAAVAQIPAIAFMFLCFSLYCAAYLCEIFRAAILSIERGQVEAAYSVGMSTAQALRRIVLPQAMLSALPNLGNFIILLLKDTSLAFVASVPEIMGQASIEAARSSKFLEVYIAAALLYWGICVALAAFVNALESRLRAKRKNIGN